MTTHVICDNPECGKKFKSQYQIANLETQDEIKGNNELCPHCGSMTLAEKRNMINEYHMGDSKGTEAGYQCPNCSDIQGDPEDHKYNMVMFEVGETEVKCSNCGVILTRKIIE